MCPDCPNCSLAGVYDVTTGKKPLKISEMRREAVIYLLNP